MALVDAHPGAEGGATVVMEHVPCDACGTDNRPGHRACRSCGIALAPPTCRACGARPDPADRFCAGCGRALAVGAIAAVDRGPSGAPSAGPG